MQRNCNDFVLSIQRERERERERERYEIISELLPHILIIFFIFLYELHCSA